MTSPALSPALSGPQVSMAAPLPGPTPSPSSAPGAFARQLQQAQTTPEPEAPARANVSSEARREAAAAGDDAGTAQGPDAADARDSAASKARALAARWLNLPGTGQADKAAADPDAAANTGNADPAQAGGDTGNDAATAADPAAALMASVQPRMPAPAPQDGGAAGADATGSQSGWQSDPRSVDQPVDRAGTPAAAPETDDAGQRPGLALGRDRLALAARNADLADAGLQALRDRLAPSDDRAQPLTPVQEAGAAAATAASSGTSGANPLPGFAAELAKATQTAGATRPDPAPAAADVHVGPPVTSPEFVPRLTGELAMLARDGVQEARVQVNPVDLGPIAVQITLDGSAAQVHLAVASDQTRQVLEQAMPALAAALRESGLTLTGGGVFQQARQNGRDAAPDGSGRAGSRTGGRDDADDGPAIVAAAPRRVRLPGSVDLYA